MNDISLFLCNFEYDLISRKAIKVLLITRSAYLEIFFGSGFVDI